MIGKKIILGISGSIAACQSFNPGDATLLLDQISDREVDFGNSQKQVLKFCDICLNPQTSCFGE